MSAQREYARLTDQAQESPRNLLRVFATTGIAAVTAVGNLDILRRTMLAFVCSVRCPGNVILQTYDLACTLRDNEITVVGGFHSPMERECLTLLLRGRQPIVICPARGIQGMRLPSAWKMPLEQGRLLVLSPFEESQRRVTTEAAQRRNGFVAALADEVLIAYAAPGGRTEQFCREVIGWGKPVLTLDCRENAHLIDMGALPISPTGLRRG